MPNEITAQLETLHVFIDTNIFRSKAFDMGNSSLEKLGQLGQEKRIHLHSTSFATREIEKNIIGHIKEVFASTKKMNIHLRNADLPELKVEAIIEGRLARWREYICDSNTDTINFPVCAVEEVFDRYFNSMPPFKDNAEKKFEFPDAFIFVALKSWCEEHKEGMYVVTEYELFRKACEGTRLLPLKKLEEFLDLYSRREPFLYKTALECFEGLKDDIKNAIKENVENRWYDIPSLWDSEVSDLEVSDIDIHVPLIIDADEEHSQIDVDVDIYVSAQVYYPDPDFEYWDSETKEVISLEQCSERISGSFSATASVQITIDLSQHPKTFDLHSAAIPGQIRFQGRGEALGDKYEIVSLEQILGGRSYGVTL